MTNLELPEPHLLPIRLDPHTRPVLGDVDPATPRTGRLAVGLPIVMPLTADTVDEHSKPFLLSRPDSTFHLLTLTISFTHDDSEPFEAAWVDVALRHTGPTPGQQPVAWSMRPRSTADTVPVSRRISLSPALKLSVPGASLEATLGVGAEREVTYNRQDVSLEALNEGTSDPRWAFYRTNATSVRGVHTLCLVIDLAANVQGTASIHIGATVRSRRLKIFRYDAALTDIPKLTPIHIG